MDTNQNCGNCRFMGLLDGKFEKHYLCRIKPPQTFVVHTGDNQRRTVVTRFPENSSRYLVR